MAEPQAPMPEGGEGRGGFSRGRGGRERGRGRGRGGRGGADDKGVWVPVTKLGRLVKAGKISSLEEIYTFSLAIKEYQIVDQLVHDLKDEVMAVMSVQKQTNAGQRTRFKAFVAVGDSKGHIGLGVKCSKEVATSIRVAINLAKISLVPVRLGYWGNFVGQPHTIVCKVTGKCGSIRVRLIPAPRGTGIVASPVPKKLLAMAGIEDVYSASTGHTRTLGNYVVAVYEALKASYAFITPDLWKEETDKENPFQTHTDFLSQEEAPRRRVPFGAERQ